MKKILTITLLASAMSVNAFWNNNNMNMPWDSGVSNYNHNNHSYGYQQDNGIFAYNPYNYWEPRWYAEEMSNVFDEFGGNGWNNNNHNQTGYGYNPRDYALGNIVTGHGANQQQEFLRQKLQQLKK